MSSGANDTGGVMRRRLGIVVAITTGLVLASGCSGSTGEDEDADSAPASVRPDGEELQSVLDGLVEDGRAAGLTAAVVSPDGSWSGAAGVDGAGATLVPTSGMAIASITKTFVAAQVMALVMDGALEPDEPIASYLPPDVQTNAATLQQVLEMHSGIRDRIGSDADAVVEEALAQPDRHWDPVEALGRLSEVFDKPGGPFTYANSNYIMLGLVIEEATGTSLAKALRDGVVGDAELDRLAVQDEEMLPGPLAAPGEDSEGVPRLEGGDYLPSQSIASLSWAAGGMAADAMSVGLWGSRLYGGHVVPRGALEQMTAFDNDQYGLGTMNFGHFAPGLVGHEGETEGYRSALLYDTKRDIAVAVLIPHRANATNPARELLAAAEA